MLSTVFVRFPSPLPPGSNPANARWERPSIPPHIITATNAKISFRITYPSTFFAPTRGQENQGSADEKAPSDKGYSKAGQKNMGNVFFKLGMIQEKKEL